MRIFYVDAFTERPFAGNPAAVCLLEHPKVDSWMQNVAAEANLSETAFLLRQGDGYNLRWFTPRVEVELCGHATLASAHVLFATSGAPRDATINFYTKSGVLRASMTDGLIELNFPATPEEEAPIPEGLEAALGVRALYVGKTQFDYFVEVASDEMVRGLSPDFVALSSIPVRGVIVTAGSDSAKFDFVSRFFCPAVGINEDPVTGSAHCALGPYWARRLNKTTLVAYQASLRGGVVRVRLSDDRVYLAGGAVTVMSGELNV
ncbi:MAG TPA: PhzF family phenazine biosynthesis protein [Syntrophorhabdaceae bacterium]|nr:PhzF family phenazine biosynthesis protein [Syntrophorhabdaceae bacterium]